MCKIGKSFVVALIFLAMMSLTACSDENSPQVAQTGGANPSTSVDGNSAPAQETSTPTPEAAAALAVLTDGAVDGTFQPLEPVTFVEEYDGYSCNITVYTWVGQSNSKDRVFHPYDSGLVIFPHKSTETVIPFAIEVETTTSNADFPTDIAVNISCFKQLASGSGGSSQTFLCTSNDLERRAAEIQQRIEIFKNTDNYTPEMIDKDMSNCLWQSNGFHVVVLEETAMGEKNCIMGYYVIDDYFSPAYPQGNHEMFGPDGVTLQLSPQLNSVYTMDTLTHYIALRPSGAYKPPATYQENAQVSLDYTVPGEISGQ